MKTKEEKAWANALRRYIMNAGFLLGIWFIIEYFVTIEATHSLWCTFIRVPMMAVMPVALCYVLYRIRDTFFQQNTYWAVNGWLHVVNITFFAALVEAAFILVFNQWIAPDNQREMHEAMLQQSQELLSICQTPEFSTQFPTLAEVAQSNLEVIRELPIPSPTQAAFNAISDDLTKAFFLAFPLAFFFRRKVQKAQ